MLMKVKLFGLTLLGYNLMKHSQLYPHKRPILKATDSTSC